RYSTGAARSLTNGARVKIAFARRARSVAAKRLGARGRSPVSPGNYQRWNEPGRGLLSPGGHDSTFAPQTTVTRVALSISSPGADAGAGSGSFRPDHDYRQCVRVGRERYRPRLGNGTAWTGRPRAYGGLRCIMSACFCRVRFFAGTFTDALPAF